MTLRLPPFRRPAVRLVVRTIAVIFVTVALVLGAVFVVLTLEARERAHRIVSDSLDSTQRVLSALERIRHRERAAQAEMLAESPALRAMLGQPPPVLAPYLGRLAQRAGADAIIVLRGRDTVVASGGRASHAWRPGRAVALAGSAAGADEIDAVASVDREVFRVAGVPLRNGLGWTLCVATSLDLAYARGLSALSRGDAVILLQDRAVASTLAEAASADLVRATGSGLAAEGVVALAGEAHAYRRVAAVGDLQVLALGSIEDAAGGTREALRALGVVATGAMALAALASVWLARTITRPIHTLSRSVSAIAASRNFDARLPPVRSSRELDALTGTFNELLGSVSMLLQSLASAEAHSHAATVGAVHALTTALDARDPYTAGHSERVSALSVSIGIHMGLPEEEMEVLRLGALLHDVGKIGIPDHVLAKPGGLNQEEFELIKQHPTLGGRILRSVPSLAPHLPIVELHHERPDGRGYPHRLKGDEIPMLARIVHVADAFDAITSARAYRASRSVTEALAELRRCAGTEFDPDVVAAVVAVITPLLTPDSRVFHTNALPPPDQPVEIMAVKEAS
jgi:HD-GYP domain-containing protein (c-di-GMP phosphodiesterase class II)